MRREECSLDRDWDVNNVHQRSNTCDAIFRALTGLCHRVPCSGGDILRAAVSDRGRGAIAVGIMIVGFIFKEGRQ